MTSSRSRSSCVVLELMYTDWRLVHYYISRGYLAHLLQLVLAATAELEALEQQLGSPMSKQAKDDLQQRIENARLRVVHLNENIRSMRQHLANMAAEVEAARTRAREVEEITGDMHGRAAPAAENTALSTGR